MSSGLFPHKGCTVPNAAKIEIAKIEIAKVIRLPAEFELEIAHRGVLHHWEVASVAATKIAAVM